MKTFLTILFAGYAAIAQQQPPLIHNVWDTNNASMTDMKGTGLTNGGTAYLDDLYRNGVRVTTTNDVVGMIGTVSNQLYGVESNVVQSATNNLLKTATNSFLSINTALPTTNGFVTASITNGLATTNYVNAITNGLATTNYANSLLTKAIFSAPTVDYSGKAPAQYLVVTNNGQQYLILLYTP